jgi:hypothetical protein
LFAKEIYALGYHNFTFFNSMSPQTLYYKQVLPSLIENNLNTFETSLTYSYHEQE